MPVWLSVAMAVLAAVLAVGGAMHAMLERQTRLIISELGRCVAEHIAECPARTRAVVDPDDSGSSPVPRVFSDSRRLRTP